METNVKALKSFKTTTITISTISLIIVTILTVLFVLLMISGGQDSSTPESVMRASDSGDASADTLAVKEGLLAIGAGLSCTGLLGAGIGQGYAAGKAAEAVGRNPEAEGRIRNMMIVGAAIAESSALYALVIAIMCLFVA